MFLRKKRFIFTLIAFVILAFFQQFNSSENILGEQAEPSPIIDTEKLVRQHAQVLRVIDGDTVEVLLNDRKEKIRVIGINSPEIVDSRRANECFGKEASDMAKEILNNQVVSLESDPTQQNVDKYGRLLRYIFINSTDFGKFMIEKGYAHEYTYDLPYKYQLEYKQAESRAREGKIGLWRNLSCAF